MATDKLSADSVSGHLYPRLISDIRTRTCYPLRIKNSIHSRYPRVTDIRGYIHLPTISLTSHTLGKKRLVVTYLVPENIMVREVVPNSSDPTCQVTLTDIRIFGYGY
jgi:hypothetical protein